MSINTNYPNLRSSLLLDFANAQQLDPRVTFSRSTTAPYYDGKTSVLAEQNLFVQSENLLTGWSNINCTITGSQTDPIGGTTAFKLVCVNGGNEGIYNTTGGNVSTGLTYSLSAWFKADSAVTLNINSTAGGFTAGNLSLTTAWQYLTITGITATNSGAVWFKPTSTVAVYMWHPQLEQRSSVTAYNATTTTAITNYIPQLLTAPINAPRFDFNPTTGESLGLLIEQSSTNLFTYSQLFNNSAWAAYVATNVIITATSNIAPDGTQTAQSLIADTSVGTSHAVRQGVVTTATSYACSVYAKANQLNQIFIREGNYTGAYSTFNLTAGTVTSNVLGGVGSITAVGNGWYRCTLVLTATANTSRFDIGVLPNSWVSGNALTWTGDGYSGIYIWGAQLEALAFPTSYIATTSAQVTRASDNATMTGTNFSSWYNASQSSLYMDFDIGYYVSGLGGTNQGLVCFGTQSNRILTYVGNYASRPITGQLYDGTTSTAIALNLGGNLTTNTSVKVAFAFNTTTLTGTYNGLATNTVTGGNLNLSLNIMYLGYRFDTSTYLNGHIRKFAYYPQAVTSAQLQALTGS